MNIEVKKWQIKLFSSNNKLSLEKPEMLFSIFEVMEKSFMLKSN